MAQLADHPTVKRFYQQASGRSEQAQPSRLDRAWLRRPALDSPLGSGNLCGD